MACIVRLPEGSVTVYENFDFSGLVALGSQVLATSENGIFLLEGNSDGVDDEENPIPIPWSLETGYSDLGSEHLKRLIGAYVGVSSSGSVTLTLTCGVDEVQRSYVSTVPQNPSPSPSRVKTARGLKGRYWQVKLSGDGGEDATIHSVSLLPRVLGRKVGSG